MSRRSIYILIAVAVAVAILVIYLIVSSAATPESLWRLCYFQRTCRDMGGGGGGSW